MFSNEIQKLADGRTSGAAVLPEEGCALPPGPTGPMRRIIRRGVGRSATPSALAPDQDENQETLAYVVEGRALLEIDGQRLMLEPGDCVVMPKGAGRRFSVVEPLTMIEIQMMPPPPDGGRS